MDLDTTLGSAASGRTIIVVSRKIGARAASPGADRYWTVGSSDACMVEGGSDNASYYADSAGIDEVAFPRVLTTPGFNVFSVRVASASSAQVYTNLIAGETFDPFSSAIVDDSAFRIGAQLDEANAISAQFAEIIVVNQSLPDASFKGVVYGLMVKYAIPVDVSNPFGISFSLAQSLGLTTSVSLDSLSVLVPPATSTTSGTVRTDVDDPNGDPVVYLKESVDALIAGLGGGAGVIGFDYSNSSASQTNDATYRAVDSIQVTVVAGEEMTVNISFYARFRKVGGVTAGATAQVWDAVDGGSAAVIASYVSINGYTAHLSTNTSEESSALEAKQFCFSEVRVLAAGTHVLEVRCSAVANTNDVTWGERNLKVERLA
jgi:hypothetical protein